MKISLTKILLAVTVCMLIPVFLFPQNYSGGGGTSGNPYLISNKTDLKYLSENSGEWSKYFKQTADITFEAADFQIGGDFCNSGNYFIPIGNESVYFTGSYNGDNYKITNLNIYRGSTDYIGLFGIVTSEIKNLSLDNSNIQGNHYVGALVGLNFGIITNCNATNVNISIVLSNGGGLVGTNEYIIQNCYSTGDISADTGNRLGGLVGNQTSTGQIINSYSSVVVESYSGEIFGGLIGENLGGTIQNCYATGYMLFAADSSRGGLIGSNSAHITNSYWNTETSGIDIGVGIGISSGVHGKTSAEMNTKSTFTGWNFTTIWGMTTSNFPKLKNSPGFPFPDIVNTNPTNNSNMTSDITNMTINFDKTVVGKPFKYIKIYGTGAVLKEQLEANSANVTISGSEVTITKNVNLTPGNYYVLIDAGAFRDGAENRFQGISDTSLWTFGIYTPDASPGDALSFPGSGVNYVSVPYSALLNPTDNFTIEFWARAEGNANTYRCPLSSQITFNGSRGYYFYADGNNKWAAWLGEGTGWRQIVGANVELNKWYHLAMTFSSGTMKFYINGEQQGTETGITFFVNSTSSFNIGDLGEALGTFPFNGKVDEIRFWNTARTQQQIQENMYLTTPEGSQNLVAYFQLNEGAGTTISDVFGNFSGSFVNSPSWSANSSIPIGSGTNGFAQSFTSGSTTLANVNLVTTDSFDDPVDISISQIDVAPNTTAGIVGTILSNKYWKIDAFGSPGTFSVDLTFTVPSDFTNNGNASASLYTLYHRNENDDGNWTATVSGASSITSTTITFNGVSSFSQFTIGTEEVLPVELVSFTVTINGQHAKLNWQTATEVNNFGFEVERKQIPLNPPLQGGSRATGEAGGFEKIGFVEGAGTSNSPKEYSFTDKNISRGNYSYRLKQIDHDGGFKYSNTVEVVMSQVPKVFLLSQNYPNPFNPTTTIEFTLQNDGITTLKIYDVIGREVATLVNEELKAGELHQVNYNASNLASGIYFARLQSNGKQMMKKMLLLK